MGKIIEKWYPFTVGGMVAALYLWLGWYKDMPPNLKELLAAVISVSAIAVGFMATAKSILFSIEKKRAVRMLKEAGEFSTLIDYLMASVNWSFLLGLLSVVGLVLDFSKMAWWRPCLAAMWLLLFVTAGVACYRVIHVLSKILRAND